MDTGRRIWKCELSTVDTALLFAGVLPPAPTSTRTMKPSMKSDQLADALYRRTDWAGRTMAGPTVSHGWRPEKGFLPIVGRI